MKQIPNRVFLTEDELPKQYYNIAADMPNRPMPYLASGHVAAHDRPKTWSRSSQRS